MKYGGILATSENDLIVISVIIFKFPLAVYCFKMTHTSGK